MGVFSSYGLWGELCCKLPCVCFFLSIQRFSIPPQVFGVVDKDAFFFSFLLNSGNTWKNI